MTPYTLTAQEVCDGIEKLEQGFMVPDVEELPQAEAREYLDDPEAEAGIYARLSAPGYLDCTDWSGPFESIRHAEEYLVETYLDEWGG
jgi:hypothetical protein